MVRRNYFGLQGVILAASLAFGTARADGLVEADLLYSGSIAAPQQVVSTSAFDLDAALSGAYVASATSLEPMVGVTSTALPGMLVDDVSVGVVDEYMAKAAEATLVASKGISSVELVVSPSLVDRLTLLRERKASRPVPVAFFTDDKKGEEDALTADAAYK